MSADRQKGIALVLVLWLLVLVTVTSGSFALMARMEQLEANQLLSGTRARLLAEGGLNLAAVGLLEPEDEFRMVGDGRVYELQLDEALLELRITDERGKLNLNGADEITLTTLFTNHGLEQQQAQLLAAAVADWRDDDDIERVDGAEVDAYLAAGLPSGPGNRPFMLNEELLQVIGMPYSLYQLIEPALTVHAEESLPSIAFAPVAALLAIPDITPEEALNFVEQRHSQSLDEFVANTLPDGLSVVAQGRGLTYSIRVKATMPNGVWEQIEATIRLGGSPTGQPYRVLRWREGFHR